MTHLRPDDIGPDLFEKLMRIEKAPERDPQKADAGLAQFLNEAQKYPAAITNSIPERHNGWMQNLRHLLLGNRKEYSPMSTLITILLATTLLFGAGGVTVAAAEGSQPDDALYHLKLWSEAARLDIIHDPTTDFQLSLEFMGRRAQEIQLILETEAAPSPELLAEYQNQIEQTIRFALNMPEDQVKQSLELIRSRLVIQQHSIVKLSNLGEEDQLEQRIQLQQMLQTRIGWLNDGLTDPQLLQLNLTLQDGSGSEDRPETGAGNPWATGTPTPGSSYGPGTGESITNTPRAYDHSGNPYTTGTPTPGSGYGPGPDQVTGTPSTQTGYKPTEGGAMTGQGYAPTQVHPAQPTSPGKKGGNN